MKISLVWCNKNFLFAHNKQSFMLDMIQNFVQMLSWMNYIFFPSSRNDISSENLVQIISLPWILA